MSTKKYMHTNANLELSATDLLKYVWPFTEHQVLQLNLRLP